jgi:hypothetical protein
MYFHNYVCVLLLMCCVGYCLSNLTWFYLLGEIFVTKFALVTLSSAVSDSNSNSVSILPLQSSFGDCRYQFSSGDRFASICAHVAFVTALCNSLRGPGHLFDPFSTICNYFSIILVCFCWGARLFFLL